MDQRPQSEMCTINSTKTAVLNMCVAALGRGFDMGKNSASRLWFPAQLDGKHMESII